MRTLVLMIALLGTTPLYATAQSLPPDRFDSMKSCQTAVLTGIPGVDYRLYQPKDLSPKAGVAPLNGTTNFPVFHPTNVSCVHMLIESGHMEYVAQAAGTVFRGRRINGVVKIYARDDCSNPADEIWFAPVKGEKGDPGPRGFTGAPGINCWDQNGNRENDLSEDVNRDGQWNAKDCEGPQGPQGLQGLAGADYAPEEESANKWGLHFGGLLGSLSSVPVQSTIANLTDREEVCITASFIGGGIAYRPDADSRWFVEAEIGRMFYSDDSFTTTCPDCTGGVARLRPRDVRSTFFSAGVAIHLTDWKIRPAAAFGLDVERMTGKVEQTIYTPVTRSAITNEVEAEVLFGRKPPVTPTLKLGVSMHPTSNTVLSVYPVGFRFPGVYSIAGVNTDNNKSVTYSAEVRLAYFFK